MRDNPKPFEIFKHFKGKAYQILTLARDAGDGHDVVVYQALYGDYTVYVRDLAEFMSPVDKVKYPDASQEYRFERQSGMNAAKKAEQNAEQKTEAGAGQAAGQEPAQSAKETVKQETGQETKQETKQEAKQETKQEAKQEEGDSTGGFLDPVVEEFLDAESVYEKLNILAGLHHRITDEMLDIMAAASDIELNEGSTQEKYAELKNCLLMTERYECKRIR